MSVLLLVLTIIALIFGAVGIGYLIIALLWLPIYLFTDYAHSSDTDSL